MDKVTKLLRGLASSRDAELSDEQLLERFVALREEAAFEGLVRRHGPMVMGVCRRVLPQYADAEDAFQATFLVLARKAATVRPRGHVAGWLHGVARRIALKARVAGLLRGKREKQVDPMPEQQLLPQHADETLGYIDEELQRLPPRYRMAIILCGIEGRSYKDAAGRLGCPEGTVGGWLCRAREMLAARLSRRGVAVPAAAAAVLLAQGAAHAVPPALVRTTVHGACLFALGQADTVSPGVAALAQGALGVSFKLKVGMAVLLVLTFAGAGVCSWWVGEEKKPAAPPDGPRPQSAAQEAIAAPPAPVPPDVLKLIDQLGDEDAAVKAEAQKKLEAMGEDVVPALERAAKRHKEVDVRLRAAVVASAINKKIFGEVDCFEGHTEGVTAVALSPDGKRMVSSSQFADVPRVWDVRTGKELFQLKEHKANVPAVAWSKDGKQILTGGFDRELMLWDAKTGKRVKTISGHLDLIYGVSFTPDGKKAVSCSKEKIVRVWDLETGKQTASNKDHPGAVRAVVVTPDGKHFVTACFDGAVRMCEVETGKLVRKMDSTHNEAWFVAVSHDGKRAASVGADNLVTLHELGTGKRLRQFSGHTAGTHAIAFLSDGKRLLSGSLDRTARVWDVESGKELQKFTHAGAVTCAAVLPGDRQAITSCSETDRSLRLWRLGK